MVTSAYDGMISKVGEKVSRMRPMPVIKDWQNACVPGTYRTGEDGESQCVSVMSEDPAWEKVDKIIVKVLDTMKQRGVKSPLTELQEAAFATALREEDRGVQLFAWRLLNTRHFVVEYGRLRTVVAGSQPPRETDGLFYGSGGPVAQAELIADALRVRGILKAKQE